jgi:acyl carrier protein
MKSEAEVRETLRGWLCRTGGKVRPEQLRDDTPILERRLISSLQVMELILFLEQLRGAPVDAEAIRPGAFRDIDSIYQSFFVSEN